MGVAVQAGLHGVSEARALGRRGVCTAARERPPGSAPRAPPAPEPGPQRPGHSAAFARPAVARLQQDPHSALAAAGPLPAILSPTARADGGQD